MFCFRCCVFIPVKEKKIISHRDLFNAGVRITPRHLLAICHTSGLKPHNGSFLRRTTLLSSGGGGGGTCSKQETRKTTLNSQFNCPRLLIRPPDLHATVHRLFFATNGSQLIL